MAEAISTGGIAPIQAFVAHRAAVVEIERRPETARAYHRANYLANHGTSVDECRKHAVAVAVAEIYRSAFSTVNR
jgi:hypothetical protein